jgi:uncharacterized LabA/DUF88 family protein
MYRVISYIDGFNLYFGLKRKDWKRYYWLNIQKLSSNLLTKDQLLILTKYFTSRIASPPDKVKRQNIFLEALSTLNNFSIFYGKYQMNSQECKRCGNIWPSPNEKMTDVNISVELLSDAFQDKFDTALLISGDSDLTGPIKKIHELFPKKRVVIAFPPETFSFELSKIADAYFTIGRKKLADSIFDDEIEKKDGFILRRPKRWE